MPTIPTSRTTSTGRSSRSRRWPRWSPARTWPPGPPTHPTPPPLHAAALWDRIAHAAWASADPGLQFDTTINDWHTCAESGRINASNPCSEYMFLDDTACNLASLNLLAFQQGNGGFAVGDFQHAVRLWTLVLEISVMMAQFPAKEIPRLRFASPTLRPGHANLG